jgi:hypothetical protein
LATLCSQWRDGPIAFFKLTTRTGTGNSVRFGGKRWDEYLRRNIRTYSSMSREVLSAPQDHACLEAQRRIGGEWLYDYTISMDV